MRVTDHQRTAFPPFDTAAASRPRQAAARRAGATLPTTILLLILLAAAQLWFGRATANTCATLEDFPCGP